MKQPKHKTRFEGEAPEGAHLIVQHRAGQYMAIPVGAHMGIVMDPTKWSPQHKMILVKVHETKLQFKCVCNPTCNVVYEYRVHQHGEHSR